MKKKPKPVMIVMIVLLLLLLVLTVVGLAALRQRHLMGQLGREEILALNGRIKVEPGGES
jgi:hypothetical protein